MTKVRSHKPAGTKKRQKQAENKQAKKNKFKKIETPKSETEQIQNGKYETNGNHTSNGNNEMVENRIIETNGVNVESNGNHETRTNGSYITKCDKSTINGNTNISTDIHTNGNHESTENELTNGVDGTETTEIDVIAVTEMQSELKCKHIPLDKIVEDKEPSYVELVDVKPEIEAETNESNECVESTEDKDSKNEKVNVFQKISKKFSKLSKKSESDKVEETDKIKDQNNDRHIISYSPKLFSGWPFVKRHSYDLSKDVKPDKVKLNGKEEAVVIDVKDNEIECDDENKIEDIEKGEIVIEPPTTTNNLQNLETTPSKFRSIFSWWNLGMAFEKKKDDKTIEAEDISIEDENVKPIKNEKRKWYNVFGIGQNGNVEKEPSVIEVEKVKTDVELDIEKQEQVIDKTEDRKMSPKNRFRKLFSLKSAKSDDSNKKIQSESELQNNDLENLSSLEELKDNKKPFNRLSTTFRSLRSLHKKKTKSDSNAVDVKIEKVDKKERRVTTSIDKSDENENDLKDEVFEENEIKPKKKRWASVFHRSSKSQESDNVIIKKSNSTVSKNLSRLRKSFRKSKLDENIKDRVTVSISLSTGYICYSYGFVKKGEMLPIHIMKNRDVADVGIYELRSISCILLDKQHSVHSVGKIARSFYNELDDSEQCHWLLFNRLNFSDIEMEPIDSNYKIKSTNGQEILVCDLLTLYIQKLKNNAFEELNTIEDVKFDTVYWTVSVSERWNKIVHDIVKGLENACNINVIDESETYLPYLKCFTIDNLTKEHDSLNLSKPLINREFSSDSLCVIDKNGNDSFYDDFVNTDTFFNLHESISVIDCGLSGASVFLYKHSDGSYQCVDKSCSFNAKSVDVDKRFINVLNKLFTTKFIEDYRNRHPTNFNQILNSFYSRKCAVFSRKQSHSDIIIPFSFIDDLQRIMNKKIEVCIDKSEVDGVSFINGILRFSNKKMISFFKFQFTALNEFISNKMNTPMYKNVKYVFLVGSFSNCQLLVESVKENIGQNCTVHLMPGSAMSVVKGALYKINSNWALQYKLANYNYSIESNIKNSDKPSHFNIKLNSKLKLKRSVSDKPTIVTLHQVDISGSNKDTNSVTIEIPQKNDQVNFPKKININLHVEVGCILCFTVNCGDFSMTKTVSMDL
ncbi:Heat shock protein HSP70 [Intoshia linei]|uniref:Heat shock protein HSP70 n=1 Tax=Intoshia linei TaxID=1819745 RepID=A0A177AWX7_9BILA|nr:Heat shock protein HSP70 [Intoshia linei]